MRLINCVGKNDVDVVHEMMIHRPVRDVVVQLLLLVPNMVEEVMGDICRKQAMQQRRARFTYTAAEPW